MKRKDEKKAESDLRIRNSLLRIVGRASALSFGSNAVLAAYEESFDISAATREFISSKIETANLNNFF